MSTTQTYPEWVAAEVRAHLARAGKDAGDLAAMLGVSRPTATARWAGTQAYGLGELYAIAQAIGVPVGVLVALPTEQLAAA